MCDLKLIFQGLSFTKNGTVEGSAGLGRFGHSVTSLGDLNNDGCDGEHAFTSCDDVCWSNGGLYYMQILLLVLHLTKEEKCSFTMGLRRQESTPLCSRQVCCGRVE